MARINISGGPGSAFGGVSGSTNGSTTPGDVTLLTPNLVLTARDLFVALVTPPPGGGLTSVPGTGAALEVILQVNGTDSPVRCTVAGTASECTSGTLEAIIPEGAQLNYRVETTGMTAATSVLVSVVLR